MMIWVLFGLMAIGLALYIAPVFLGAVDAPVDAELADYLAQIDTIEADDSLSSENRDAALATLKRQVLKRERATTRGARPGLAFATLGALGVMGAGIYMAEGRPDLTGQRGGGATVEAPAPGPDADVAQLIAQLEERLQGDSADDPNGWVLYARSLMGLGRFEDALRAYDRVVALTDQNPDAVEERDRARAFVAQRGAGAPPALDARPQRGPTAQDVRDADAMSETDRAAMIQGMVDGLAARLESSPDDPAGWARLIRARQVMGDAGQAARDVQTVRELYADQPETLAQILTSAEWDG